MVKNIKTNSVVGEAIAQAEAKTSAEVVVTVVRRSGNYDHVYAVVFCAALTVTLIFGLEAWLYRAWLPFGWSPQIALVLMILLSALLSFGLSRLPPVMRLLTSDDAISRWVALRAEVEFFEKILGKTANATGVLIFVSLIERRTVILADKPIFEKLPRESFDAIMNTLNQKIGRGDLDGGLVAAVVAIGDMLGEKFARLANDVNEVSDQVIFKDD